MDSLSNFFPLIKKYKVDIVLTGHIHCFQPGRVQLEDGHQIHFISSGGAGGRLDTYIYNKWFTNIILDKYIDTKHHHFLKFIVKRDRLQMKVIALNKHDKRMELALN